MERSVFISYAAENQAEAHRACQVIESNGIPCWIAPRDIPGSAAFAEAIMQGINAARVVVLIYSSAANASPYVALELNHAVSQRVPIMPFRIENHLPTGSIGFLLGLSQWLDAFEGSLADHWERLLQAIVDRLQPAADVPAALTVIDLALGKLPNRDHAPTLNEVTTIMGLAISFGAPIYNAGSHAGCAEIYLRTAHGLIAALERPIPPNASGATTARLAAVGADLRQASSLHPGVTPKNANEFAWALRRAFDRTFHIEVVERATAHVDHLLAEHTAGGAKLKAADLHEILLTAIAYGNKLYEEEDLSAIVTLHLHTAHRLLAALPDGPDATSHPDHRQLAAARAELAPFRHAKESANSKDAAALAWSLYEAFLRLLPKRGEE